ncbi:uncharacterized protein LOC135814898 [Sycon ciliatum]|uniref:uncharacterized protein LOC135814898 n=1 Tax=Sycon ciliatum TaxID=27933 RepID=UPI0031F6D73E
MFVSILSVVALSAVASASNVVDLTSENFDNVVTGDKYAFVEFYAPWCGHCKNLAPVYEQVGDAFAGESDVIIAKVDADADRELGSRFGVSGFPTLKFFEKSSTASDYSGGRTADDIVNYINGKAGTRARVKKPQTHVVDLDPSNFDGIVKSAEKDVLVEFYAPWCGHCKSLAPVYEKVGSAFKSESNCVVARVDADSHRSLGEQFGVSGFPTIKFFPKDNKDGEDYSEGRSESDFISFLNKRCGTQRASGGSLTAEAGLVEDLNALAARFMKEEDAREDIISEATKVADGQDNAMATYYVKIMQKIQTKGNEFPTTESSRLERMSGKVSDKKADEFTIRRNILSQFA